MSLAKGPPRAISAPRSPEPSRVAVLPATASPLTFWKTAPIRVIQVLLGHAKLDNTAFYTKVATRTVRTVTSPLDKLGLFNVGEISPDG
jgi:hypothetical protein